MEITYSSEDTVRDMDYSDAVLNKVKETMYTQLVGDILAFLPAVEDVKTCYHALRETLHWNNLPGTRSHQVGLNNHCWTTSKHVVNLTLCFCFQPLLKASQLTAPIIIDGLLYVDDRGWLASHHPGLVSCHKIGRSQSKTRLGIGSWTS